MAHGAPLGIDQVPLYRPGGVLWQGLTQHLKVELAHLEKFGKNSSFLKNLEKMREFFEKFGKSFEKFGKNPLKNLEKAC